VHRDNGSVLRNKEWLKLMTASDSFLDLPPLQKEEIEKLTNEILKMTKNVCEIENLKQI
jgi:hypothetical protein